MQTVFDRARMLGGMIDSHFHSLEMVRKGLDSREVLRWCFENGLTTAIDIATTPENMTERRSLTGGFPGIFYSAGYYPSETHRFTQSAEAAEAMLSLLRRELSVDRTVAVGEIGLDEYHNYAPVESQLVLFRAQLEVARDLHLPVVIHNRDSDRLTHEALKSAGLDRGGVMHCFSADYDTAKSFIDLGFFISFAGNVTFKNASTLQDTARRVPVESILIETDSPYLAPMPVRGRANHPAYIGHTYQFLAELKGVPVEELIAHVRRNFSRLFGI